jgi:hypothetical protein
MRSTPGIESARPHAFGEMESVKQEAGDIGADRRDKGSCASAGVGMSNRSKRDKGCLIKDIPQNRAAAHPCVQNSCSSGANIAKLRNKKKAIRHGC